MDDETARALADIRMELSQLQSALGTETPDEAEAEVMALKSTVMALVVWAQTVTPPFSG